MRLPISCRCAQFASSVARQETRGFRDVAGVFGDNAHMRQAVLGKTEPTSASSACNVGGYIGLFYVFVCYHQLSFFVCGFDNTSDGKTIVNFEPWPGSLQLEACAVMLRPVFTMERPSPVPRHRASGFRRGKSVRTRAFSLNRDSDARIGDRQPRRRHARHAVTKPPSLLYLSRCRTDCILSRLVCSKRPSLLHARR